MIMLPFLNRAFLCSSLAGAGVLMALAMPSAHAMAAAPSHGATTTLVDAQGTTKGQVHIQEEGDSLALTVQASGLTPGVHGIHIHTVGRCDAPDFASAGGHWNPGMRRHGADNPDGAHLGDLPNLVIGADGTGNLAFTVSARLDSGTHPLFDADGAAFIVHAGPDDMKTDPAGNSGGRIACGIFRKD